tara:strand:+ start:332 stop:517 length:186 start_codon:yes stop_codon:yes gene_type:complete
MVDKEEIMFIKEIKGLLKVLWSTVKILWSTVVGTVKTFLDQFRFWNVALALIIFLLIFFYN